MSKTTSGGPRAFTCGCLAEEAGFDGGDGDAEGKGVAAAAVEDAADGAHVGVVAAAGDDDVIFADEAVVGGIVVDPAVARDVDGHPRVHGVGADEGGLAGRRLGAEITAHVGGGEAEAAGAGEVEVGEILADAAAGLQDRGEVRAEVGRGGVEVEIAAENFAEGGEGGDEV